MPRTSNWDQLARLIEDLRQQRAKHEQAIASIDAAFARYGIAAPARGKPGPKPGGKPGRPAGAAKPGPKPGPKAGKKKRGRKKRGSFAVSGEQQVLDFVKKAVKTSTAEINNDWKTSGRGGSADNTLTKLVKDGKLKRLKNKEGRGSLYTVA